MSERPSSDRPRIAVFSGPTTTIANSPPLLTSNKARRRHGLSVLRDDSGAAMVDALRPQRLAAPVTVYVRQFSAHPLEADTAHLYAPPDGWLDAEGVLHDAPTGADDTPVFEVVLDPGDGLYPLPFMARRANGEPWDPGDSGPFPKPGEYRQTFYPDASRVFEEIDRFGIGADGRAGLLSARAEYDFYRAGPAGGYTQGLHAEARTDVGEGDIPPELPGVDYYPYLPPGVKREPGTSALGHLTNVVQRALATGSYAGAIWLEGSPAVEETAYWLNLVIDTTVPIVGVAAQRPHAGISEDGSRNLLDAVDYIRSDVWMDDEGRDSIGVVVIQDEQIFTAREVQKADARPGGFEVTGGHGGVIGTTRDGLPALTFLPVRRHTHTSDVNLSEISGQVTGVAGRGAAIEVVPREVKGPDGNLQLDAIPTVTIVKFARFLPHDTNAGADAEPEVLARIEANLTSGRLAGFVAEGATPFGSMSHPVDAALRLATFSGMPVVKVGRGNPGGSVNPRAMRFCIAGSSLTATKARMLLMTSLLRFGSLPPAADPANPTAGETAAVLTKVHEYQAVFDSH